MFWGLILTRRSGPGDRDGRIVELDDESATTSELLQAHLPQSHVVKTFNNIFFHHLAA